jgi:hypothetical protein
MRYALRAAIPWSNIKFTYINSYFENLILQFPDKKILKSGHVSKEFEKTKKVTPVLVS